MFRNYLLIALRRLAKHRDYTLLNSLGLGLTVACCLLIFLLVRHQLSFDSFHLKSGQIGRVVTELQMENVRYSSGVPYPMAAALRGEFAFIQKAATVDGYNEVVVEVPGDKGAPVAKFKEENQLAYAEPEIFDILRFPLMKGNLAAFSEPNTALVTEKTARKYFGTTDALGRSFRAFDDKKTFRIVGILRDMPSNTDCGREVFCSWATLKSGPEQKEISSWGSIRGNTRCYILLAEGHSMGELAAALPAFSQKFPHPVRKELFAYRAYPLSELHFDTRYGGSFEKRYLWALGFIGLFLLITACVNFVNMATAQSLTRAREVGVRKAMGSTRAHLFGQFMLETSLLVLFSLLIGGGMSGLILPYLNDWTRQHLELGALAEPGALFFLLLLGLLLTWLAGAYPGMVLARFQAAQSLKGEISGGGFSLRRGLVATQFAISQLLIIGAVVVGLQMHYAQDSDWGFQRESIVTVPLPDASKTAVLKQRLDEVPGIQNMSFCSAPPASASGNQTLFKYEDRSEPEKWAVHFLWADDNYLATFGLQLAAGRNFDANDSLMQCFVNETFVKKLNLGPPERVVGTHIRIGNNPILIAGVVRDFHMVSFREDIPPVLIQKDPKSYSICALRLEPGNPKAALKNVESTWNSLFPTGFYEYRFLDEQIAGFYSDENMMMQLVNLFAGIAILISSIGLFGLTAFMIVRKTKEIGIRKIMGASLPGILWLFGKEYAKLIVLAFLVAAPLGWWVMHQWLADFSYRIDIGWPVFAAAGTLVVVITLLTVGFQSIKAALANPANSLRNE